MHNPPEAMNIGTAERIGSVIAGSMLLARAVARPSLARLLVAAVGAALVQRGVTGQCSLYRLLGLDGAVEADLTPRNAAGDDPVDLASDDSFPASDPPSWTPVAGTASKHQPASAAGG